MVLLLETPAGDSTKAKVYRVTLLIG
jgi:hypothetical protein